MDGQSEEMRRLIDAGAECARLMCDSSVSADKVAAAFGAFAAAVVEWAIPFVMDIVRSLSHALKKSVRRDWPRPQNQRVRPLLIDKRRKTYHCRNAI